MERLPKIVQRGLRESEKPGVHPDPDLLAGFAEKSLNDRERTHVLQHLATCADCRDVLALAMPEVEAAPLPIREKSRWLSWPVLRWGALAACVVVVTAAVTLHYERRPVEEPTLQAKAVAAPQTGAVESNSPKQPEQKLAEKIAPPALFPTDRDSGAVDDLAKQRKKSSDAGMARTEAAAPRAPDQNQEFEALTDNRAANLNGLKSAGKAQSPVGSLAAAAPAPLRMVAPQAPGSQPVRGDAVDNPAKSNVQAIAAESAPAAMPGPVEGKAKDESSEKELHSQLRAAREEALSADSTAERKVDTVSTETAQVATGEYAKRSRVVARIAPRWTLSADGVLRRSFDSGKSWQTIVVASNVVFRALAANDSDIWVGGAAGVLYHSSDAGQRWTQVKPVADGRPLTADIVTVDFSDAQHGKLTTANHETWTTSDSGETWQRH